MPNEDMPAWTRQTLASNCSACSRKSRIKCSPTGETKERTVDCRASEVGIILAGENSCLSEALARGVRSDGNSQRLNLAGSLSLVDLGHPPTYSYADVRGGSRNTSLRCHWTNVFAIRALPSSGSDNGMPL